MRLLGCFIWLVLVVLPDVRSNSDLTFLCHDSNCSVTLYDSEATQNVPQADRASFLRLKAHDRLEVLGIHRVQDNVLFARSGNRRGFVLSKFTKRSFKAVERSKLTAVDLNKFLDKSTGRASSSDVHVPPHSSSSQLPPSGPSAFSDPSQSGHSDAEDGADTQDGADLLVDAGHLNDDNESDAARVEHDVLQHATDHAGSGQDNGASGIDGSNLNQDKEYTKNSVEDAENNNVEKEGDNEPHEQTMLPPANLTRSTNDTIASDDAVPTADDVANNVTVETQQERDPVSTSSQEYSHQGDNSTFMPDMRESSVEERQHLSEHASNNIDESFTANSASDRPENDHHNSGNTNESSANFVASSSETPSATAAPFTDRTTEISKNISDASFGKQNASDVSSKEQMSDVSSEGKNIYDVSPEVGAVSGALSSDQNVSDSQNGPSSTNVPFGGENIPHVSHEGQGRSAVSLKNQVISDDSSKSHEIRSASPEHQMDSDSSHKEQDNLDPPSQSISDTLSQHQITSESSLKYRDIPDVPSKDQQFSDSSERQDVSNASSGNQVNSDASSEDQVNSDASSDDQVNSDESIEVQGVSGASSESQIKSDSPSELEGISDAAPTVENVDTSAESQHVSDVPSDDQNSSTFSVNEDIPPATDQSAFSDTSANLMPAWLLVTVERWSGLSWAQQDARPDNSCHSRVSELLLCVGVVLCALITLFRFVQGTSRERVLKLRVNEQERRLATYKLELTQVRNELNSAIAQQQGDAKSATAMQQAELARCQAEERCEAAQWRVQQLEESLGQVQQQLSEQQAASFKSAERTDDAVLESVSRLDKELKQQRRKQTATIDKLKADKKQLQQQVSEHKSSISNLNNQLQQVRNTLESSEKECEQFSTKLQHAHEIAEQRDSQLTGLTEENTAICSKLRVVEAELSEARDSLVQAEELADSLSSQLETLTNTTKQLSEHVHSPDSDVGGEQFVEKLMDTVKVKASLDKMTRERSKMKDKWRKDRECLQQLRDSEVQLQQEMSEAVKKCEAAEVAKYDAESKLEHLEKYFQKKELAFLEEMGVLKHKLSFTEGDASDSHQKLLDQAAQLVDNKQLINSLKQELQEQERLLRSQLQSVEKQLHECWIARRQADRKAEQAQLEAAQSRAMLLQHQGVNGGAATTRHADKNGLLATDVLLDNVSSLTDCSSLLSPLLPPPAILSHMPVDSFIPPPDMPPLPPVPTLSQAAALPCLPLTDSIMPPPLSPGAEQCLVQDAAFLDLAAALPSLEPAVFSPRSISPPMSDRSQRSHRRPHHHEPRRRHVPGHRSPVTGRRAGARSSSSQRSSSRSPSPPLSPRAGSSGWSNNEQHRDNRHFQHMPPATRSHHVMPPATRSHHVSRGPKTSSPMIHDHCI